MDYDTPSIEEAKKEVRIEKTYTNEGLELGIFVFGHAIGHNRIDATYRVVLTPKF